MSETRKTIVAQIIEKRFGVEDYDGFLSSLAEFHAMEFGLKYGLVAGLSRTSPEVAAGAATLAGVSTIRKVADTGLPKFAQNNRFYVILFFVVGFAIGVGAGTAITGI